MGARPQELLEIDLHFPTLGEIDRPRRDLARLFAYISADGEGAGFPKQAASQCSGKARIESRGGARVREQYARKAPKRGEPNDRRHEAETEKKIRRMRPEMLDRLLREDED